MIVVADTGPLNYLILSGHVVLVHELYAALLIPTAAHRELLHPRAPLKVREWSGRPHCPFGQRCGMPRAPGALATLDRGNAKPFHWRWK